MLRRRDGLFRDSLPLPPNPYVPLSISNDLLRGVLSVHVESWR